MITDLFRRLRALLRPGLVERELHDELEFHLHQEIDRLRRAGLSPEAARRRAHLALGGPEQVREACRDARGLSSLVRLRQDVRFAIRVLRRAPAFSATVIATLGLGIGATGTAFGVLDGILLKPLPYPHADRLVQLGTTFGTITVSAMSAADAADVGRRAKALEAVGLARARTVDVTGSGAPEHVAAAAVSASFFEVLGVVPELGAAGAADQMRPTTPAVVISHRYWRDRLGAAGDVIGWSLAVDGTPHTVIGVLPRTFRGPEALELSDTDFWLPLQPGRGSIDDRDNVAWRAIARLAPGRTAVHAAAELDVIGEAIGRESGGDRRRFWIAGLRDQTLGDTGREIWLLFAAISTLLVVACANIASLCVVRALGRSRELAIRIALGASRRRIARQLLAESALLASAGGALGVGLAAVGLGAFRALAPPDLPRLSEVALDARVLGFSVAVTAGATLAFGLTPALDARRSALAAVLRGSAAALSASLPRVRLRSGLAVVQISLAVVLLVGSGLLVHSLVRLGRVDPGFDVRDLVWVDVTLPARYPDASSRLQFVDDLLRELRATTGIDGVGAIVGRPFGGGNAVATIQPADRRPVEGAPATRVPYHVVTPGYFTAMAIPLLDGRDVRDADGPTSPRVAVVSRSFAARVWPGERAVGKRLWVGRVAPDAPQMEIVGVVDDVLQYDLAGTPEPILYRPFAQSPVPRSTISLVIRHEEPDSAGVLDRARDAIWKRDPALPLDRAGTMQDALRTSIGEPRFRALALAIFAIIAASVSGVGLYATLAWLVRARRREIGIRMALGAGRPALRGLLLWRGVRLTAAGMAIGTGGAVLASRWLQSMVFGISTIDAAAFAGGLTAMGAIAALACWLPMRRAAAIDPVETLRVE